MFQNIIAVEVIFCFNEKLSRSYKYHKLVKYVVHMSTLYDMQQFLVQPEIV